MLDLGGPLVQGVLDLGGPRVQGVLDHAGPRVQGVLDPMAFAPEYSKFAKFLAEELSCRASCPGRFRS